VGWFHQNGLLKFPERHIEYRLKSSTGKHSETKKISNGNEHHIPIQHPDSTLAFGYHIC